MDDARPMHHRSLPSRPIGVALAEPTTAAARAALARAARVADVVELRLDLMDEFDLPGLLDGRPCPVIVTCRAAREGGRWAGGEAARLDVLRQAIALGVDYVDVEGDAIHQIRARGASRLIASSHDFARMPDDLPGLWARLAETGADIIKVVGMAHDAGDVGAIVGLLDVASRPTIAIAMGPAGLATRVLALRSARCFLTFCSLDDGGGTAPGQIGVAELLDVYRARELAERTAIVGLLGPTIDRDAVRRWNDGLRAGGIDAVAVPLIVPDDAEIGSVLASLEPCAPRQLRVPPAHQETVGQAMARLDRSACRAGRVDTVAREGTDLVGYWTGSAEASLALLGEIGAEP